MFWIIRVLLSYSTWRKRWINSHHTRIHAINGAIIIACPTLLSVLSYFLIHVYLYTVLYQYVTLSCDGHMMCHMTLPGGVWWWGWLEPVQGGRCLSLSHGLLLWKRRCSSSPSLCRSAPTECGLEVQRCCSYGSWYDNCPSLIPRVLGPIEGRGYSMIVHVTSIKSVP